MREAARVPFHVERDLVRRLDFSAALDETLRRVDDFFPSRVAFDAAAASDRFLPTFRTQLGRDVSIGRAGVVPVPKWGGAFRPAADVGVRERLILDSLIALLRAAVPEGIVNWSTVGADRVAAERELVADGTGYVLVTDVANFYERISHSILITELTELTGEDDAINALEAFLGVIQGGDVGVPQGPPAVGWLADIYLSIADRRLARAGVDFTRSSDDYRVAAPTWRDAMRAQQTLESALRELGLGLNVGKTWTPTAEKFSQWLDHTAGEVTQQEAQETPQDPATNDGGARAAAPRIQGPYDWYDDEDLPALEDADPAIERGFSVVLERASYWGSRQNATESYRLTGLMRELGGTSSGALARDLAQVMRSYPHLTRTVATQLRRQVGTAHENQAIAAIDRCVTERTYLFDWQLGWLLHVAIPAREWLPESLTGAAQQFLLDSDAPWFVRGRAAILLATEGKLTLDEEFTTLFEVAPDSTRADFVAAAAAPLMRSPDSEAFVNAASNDHILRAIPDVIARGNRPWW